MQICGRASGLFLKASLLWLQSSNHMTSSENSQQASMRLFLPVEESVWYLVQDKGFKVAFLQMNIPGHLPIFTSASHKPHSKGKMKCTATIIVLSGSRLVFSEMRKVYFFKSNKRFLCVSTAQSRITRSVKAEVKYKSNFFPPKYT